MSASLVGSEMCIRDSPAGLRWAVGRAGWARSVGPICPADSAASAGPTDCLLYTSDAADDM
eukprot:8151206-Alexandrium_andersonii.AAC.1